MKINDKQYYLWRAVDQEGEVLDAVDTTKRDRAATCHNIGYHVLVLIDLAAPNQ